jgi:5-methylthioadenosine/S-adenosylhomocysteine deaminase
LWQNEIGSLEAGKKADIAIFGLHHPDWLPLYNPLSNFIYAAPGSTARTVIVNGAVVMEDGRLHTVDEEALYEEVLQRQAHILEATGLAEAIQPKWPVM